PVEQVAQQPGRVLPLAVADVLARRLQLLRQAGVGRQHEAGAERQHVFRGGRVGRGRLVLPAERQARGEEEGGGRTGEGGRNDAGPRQALAHGGTSSGSPGGRGGRG